MDFNDLNLFKVYFLTFCTGPKNNLIFKDKLNANDEVSADLQKQIRFRRICAYYLPNLKSAANLYGFELAF